MTDEQSRLAAPPDTQGAYIAFDFIGRRIELALRQRVRYRYVRPSVCSEARGLRVQSPCCSRNIDAAGGVIDIALFTFDKSGYWRLHARDHAAQRWRLRRRDTDLGALLTALCQDPDRVFWP